MNGLAELLAECDTRDIRLSLAGDGGLCIDARPDALTHALMERLKAKKVELLTMLRDDTPTAVMPETLDTWQPVPNHLDTDSEPAVLGSDGWPIDYIDPYALDPCPKCGMLEQWQTLAGNWRCERCDPPIKAS